jgi:hypothetical protein
MTSSAQNHWSGSRYNFSGMSGTAEDPIPMIRW